MVLLPLRLGPMLRFRESEVVDEVLLLNRDRAGKHIEYLSYTTGRTECDVEMAGALQALLAPLQPAGEEALDDIAASQEAQAPEGLMLDQEDTAQPLGDVLDGHEILAELGRGGMGVVSLARQQALGRIVALKTLPKHLADSERSLARFKREMRVLGGCDHPNIVKLHDSAVTTDGHHYYTMEYVPGVDLDDVFLDLQKLADQPLRSLGLDVFADAVFARGKRRRESLEMAYQKRLIQSQGGLDSDLEPEAMSLPLPQLRSHDFYARQVNVSQSQSLGGYVSAVLRIIRDAALALQNRS